MFSPFTTWWEVAIVLCALGLVIFPSVIASLRFAKKMMHLLAEPSTLAENERLRTQLEEAERKVAELTRKNGKLRGTFHQSALYDEHIAEYMALRLKNEREAALVDLEENKQ